MSSRKPLPLKLSPRARQDFIDILRYTGETWGERQLLNLSRQNQRRIAGASGNPELGHSRGDLPPTHRAYLVGSHIIVFRIIADNTGVIRILHQRMSLTKHRRCWSAAICRVATALSRFYPV